MFRRVQAKDFAVQGNTLLTVLQVNTFLNDAPSSNYDQSIQIPVYFVVLGRVVVMVFLTLPLETHFKAVTVSLNKNQHLSGGSIFAARTICGFKILSFIQSSKLLQYQTIACQTVTGLQLLPALSGSLSCKTFVLNI